MLVWKYKMETSKDSMPPEHPPFVDRYFERKYYINRNQPPEDICILIHSNKICLVTLAERHPVIKERKKVLKVEWKFGSVNRLNNHVVGKGKKGGQSLTATSLLCEIQCEDGSSYKVACGLKGALIEINENLKTRPNLVVEKPQEEGYIAIVLSKMKDFQEEKNKLLSPEEYKAAITESDMT